MYEYKAKVVSVHDGDTFRADVDLGFGVWINDQAFRLNRINAPELVKGDIRGTNSRDRLKSYLLSGDGNLIIKTEKDKTEKYGRMLAEVFITYDMIPYANVNDLMVQQGYALYWDGRGERPV